MDKETLGKIIDARKNLCIACKDKNPDYCKMCQVTKIVNQVYEEMEKEQLR